MTKRKIKALECEAVCDDWAERKDTYRGEAENLIETVDGEERRFALVAFKISLIKFKINFILKTLK